MAIFQDNAFEKGLSNYFSAAMLSAIQAARVGIAGAGGLGSNCAVNLVRCGFRKLFICDFDRVEAHNLNRQFYFIEQIGKLKVEALKDNLLRINPNAEITTSEVKVTEANVRQLFAGCDIVVEAFDRAECKRMLIEALFHSGKFLVSASGLAGWGKADGIVTRKIHDLFYLVGDGVSEVAPGRPPCAPMVNVAAAKEADLVLSGVLSSVGSALHAGGA